jgi:hypothetical protein
MDMCASDGGAKLKSKHACCRRSTEVGHCHARAEGTVMSKALTPKKSDLRDIKLFPKNNFFCYRWRVVDNFNKTFERELVQQHLEGGLYHQSLQNERILALYKMSYRKRRKNDFISQLTQDAMTFLDSRRTALSKAVREESAYTKSMANVVDAIFNILLSCSIELNTVLGFSELFVAATEPEVQTYTVNGQTKVRSLHARFSTSVFSLVMHGHKNRIDFYVVPVEELIGNKHPGSGYQPVVSCEAEIDGSDVNWNANGQTLTEEMMETVCHITLRQLVEATQQVLAQHSPQAM